MSRKRIRPSRFRDLFTASADNSYFSITKGPEDNFPSQPENRFSLRERLAIFKEVKRKIAAARDGGKR